MIVNLEDMMIGEDIDLLIECCEITMQLHPSRRILALHEKMVAIRKDLQRLIHEHHNQQQQHG